MTDSNTMTESKEHDRNADEYIDLKSLEENGRAGEADENAPPVEAQNTPDATEYITGVTLAAVLSSVTLVIFLVMLDMSIIATAIPQMTSDFQSLNDIGWYGSAYLLTSCVLQPLAGKLFSYFNSKITFLAFLGLFELGSLLCGVAVSSKMFILGRAVAGLGCSGLSIGALTIIASSAPMHKRPALMGIMMGVSQIGVISGPLLGGAFTEYVTWRWCFYINLPIGGLAAIIFLFCKIPDNSGKGKTANLTPLEFLLGLDFGGLVLFSGFAVMFLLGLEWGGNKYPWNSATVIGLLCGGAAALSLLGIWEFRVGDDAMIPPSIVMKRVVWTSCFVAFFFWGSLLTLSYYLPIYFQAVRGVSPTTSGVYVLPSVLSQIVWSVISGVLVGKMGYYLLWAAVGAAIVAIASGLMSTFTAHTSTALWVIYQILAGSGRGAGFQMPLVAVQNCLSQEQVPTGMAVLAFMQTFGGSLFLIVAQTVFGQSLVSGLKQFAPSVNAAEVISVGASAFREIVQPPELMGVVEAYNYGVKHVFYVALAASLGGFVFSWGTGWKKVKKALI